MNPCKKQLVKLAVSAALFLIVLVAMLSSLGHAQSTQPYGDGFTGSTGQTLTFDNGRGDTLFTLGYFFTGSPASSSIVFKGCFTGDAVNADICDTLETYTGNANSTHGYSGAKTYNYYTVAISLTGGTSPKLKVKRLSVRAAIPGSSSGGAVDSVAGKTGAVSLNNGDVGLDQVTNVAQEATANKSTTQALGTSDVLFPTQNAVKVYVDAHAGGTPAEDVITNPTSSVSLVTAFTYSKAFGGSQSGTTGRFLVSSSGGTASAPLFHVASVAGDTGDIFRFCEHSFSTCWTMNQSGHIVPTADNTRDLGDPTHGYRNIYASTKLFTPLINYNETTVANGTGTANWNCGVSPTTHKYSCKNSAGTEGVPGAATLSVGSSTAVQASDGAGGFVDGGCTELSGVHICPGTPSASGTPASLPAPAAGAAQFGIDSDGYFKVRPVIAGATQTAQFAAYAPDADCTSGQHVNGADATTKKLKCSADTGGGVSGSGTTGKPVKWVTGSTLGDSGYADIVGLWSSCTSGFLKYDGTCSASGGNGFVTAPANPGSTCSQGDWSASALFHYDCYATNQWQRRAQDTTWGLATPTFSPAAGTYSSTQSVSMLGTTGGSRCYRTDGSDPVATTPGTCDSPATTYSGAVSTSSTTTYKVLDTKAGFANSAVATGLFTIAPAFSMVHVTPACVPNGGNITIPSTASGSSLLITSFFYNSGLTSWTGTFSTNQSQNFTAVQQGNSGTGTSYLVGAHLIQTATAGTTQVTIPAQGDISCHVVREMSGLAASSPYDTISNFAYTGSNPWSETINPVDNTHVVLITMAHSWWAPGTLVVPGSPGAGSQDVSYTYSNSFSNIVGGYQEVTNTGTSSYSPTGDPLGNTLMGWTISLKLQ